MKKLRKMLDDRNIKWVNLDMKGCLDDFFTLERTRFYTNDGMISVVNGYGTYGGYDPIKGENEGLLEMLDFSKEDPVGWLTAEQVIEMIGL